ALAERPLGVAAALDARDLLLAVPADVAHPQRVAVEREAERVAEAQDHELAQRVGGPGPGVVLRDEVVVRDAVSRLAQDRAAHVAAAAVDVDPEDPAGERVVEALGAPRGGVAAAPAEEALV